MIDQLDDKQGRQDIIGRGQREQVPWGDLQVHLGLQDSFRADEFRKLSTKKFWDNRRNAPGMICSGLDRFYLNHTLIQLGGQTAIWHSLTHVSDHAPVVLKIHQQHLRTQNQPAFNRHLLDDENEKTLLLAEWTRAMALNSNKTWNKTLAYRAQRSKAFTAQLTPVIEAEQALLHNWNDQGARDTLNLTQIELHMQRQKLLESKHDKHMSEWTRIGDRCNREFFKFHTGYKKPTLISELIDDGRSLTNQEEMQYYQPKSHPLLLHFEKAYDTISWNFLKETILHMGFPTDWVELIMTLYSEASTRIMLNWVPREQFSLQRYLRQGCPLALYLYLLVKDEFRHMLSNPHQSLHLWIPCKIAAIQWLYLVEDLSIREWRAKASSTSISGLSHSEEIETSEHALFNCPKIATTWEYFTALRFQSQLSDNY
uniref:Reverse transcriptase domain-containing protein n=2 Tax=Physcomitrium patens TaxID=3218 RepID=A0A2K1IE06_PHYPA|nr:hypothetical protein PHYPA_029652 [Physcomitrium patens]